MFCFYYNLLRQGKKRHVEISNIRERGDNYKIFSWNSTHCCSVRTYYSEGKLWEGWILGRGKSFKFEHAAMSDIDRKYSLLLKVIRVCDCGWCHFKYELRGPRPHGSNERGEYRRRYPTGSLKTVKWKKFRVRDIARTRIRAFIISHAHAIKRRLYGPDWEKYSPDWKRRTCSIL